jgi:hypothetical protein
MASVKGPKRHRICAFLFATLVAIQLAIFGVINSLHEKQLAVSLNVVTSMREDFTVGGNAHELQEGGSVLTTKLPNPSFEMNFTSDSQNLWDDSILLPQWMKDYFSWHRYQTSQITQNNWEQYRYCVMRCYDKDAKCGGTADRLKTVPLIVYWAARTKRIILIYWNRPTSLEAFLLPPEGGIDWRVPDWMVRKVVHGRIVGNVDKFPEKFLRTRTGDITINTKLQSYNGGSLYYNANVGGPRFEEIFHEVWRTMFTPSLPIQKIIQEHLLRFNLRPGEYAAAHLRGQYGKIVRRDAQLHRMAENAINCASNLRPEGPIYFASDSKIVIDHVVGTLSRQTTTRIVALQRDYEPLHLEKALNWQNRSASEYYDTFVDLYLLALSKCVTYNVGGFGEWGLWISRHPNCSIQHGELKAIIMPCNWTGIATPEYSKPVDVASAFLPPMANRTLKGTNT